MVDKFSFYDEHGAEEYYIYNPDKNSLSAYVRQGEALLRVRKLADFVSPRLGIRFDTSGPELTVRYPDGRPFLSFEEVDAERRAAEQRTTQAERRAGEAAQQAQQANQRAAQAEQRLARVAELTLKVLRQQATPEEIAELERLLAEPSPPA
jgi:hypothetical protein